MKITCSAGKGAMTPKSCLACSLKEVHPPCNYDYALLKALFSDSEQERRRNEVHVTDITGCLRKSYLDKTSPAPEYVHEMLTRWLGTSVHAAIEGSDEMLDSELSLSWEGLVGKSDIVYKDGRVVDLKCQPAGQLVTMADGTEKKIEDIRIFEEVLSWDGQRFVPARVTAIMDGGVQDVYEIRIATGQSILVSGNHPVLTDRGFVQAKELDAHNDRIKMLKGWTGQRTMSPEDARLLGYLTGDGSTSRKYGIGFTNEDPELVDDLRAICETKGWELHSAGPSTKIDYRITNAGLKMSTTGPIVFIQSHGLHGKTSHTKTVPPDIMAGDQKTISNFLAAYFDCDGTITSPDGTIPARITMCTVSKEMAYQIQELLRRLDITSRVWAVITGYGIKTTGEGYHIGVWQADQILRFGDVIPFRCEHKRQRLDGWRPTLEATLRKGGKNVRRVEEVNLIGPMQTIGLEVENTHTYITRGVITHNTTRWIYPEKLPYGSHTMQVNIYAYMLRKAGRKVDRLQIQYIDMSGPSKCRKCKVPVRWVDGELKCPVCNGFVKGAHLGAYLVEAQILTDQEIEEYVIDRKEALQNSLEMGIMPEMEPGYLCNYCPFCGTDKCNPAIQE